MKIDEVLHLQSEDVGALAADCVNGATPPCAAACPFALDVRSFIQKAEKGRDTTTFKTYRDAVVFPVLVSHLCPAPCEARCSRGRDLGGAINLRGIERSVVERSKNARRDSYVIPQKSKRIAIVGAGYAGLSAALCLSLKRYVVTVFETADAWGGAVRTHPDFPEFDAELTASFAPLDTDFRFNAPVGDLTELADYDAIYVATGTDALALAATEMLAENGGKAFLGGGIIGDDLMAAIARGRRVATQIEAFVQTGAFTQSAAAPCDWTPEIDDATPAPRTDPTDASGIYTADEAKAEAARCLKCDCDKCLRGCEMLARYRKMPQKIAVEVHSDTRVNPPYSSHTITRQAYSCNNCGYCATGCPKSIDTGEILRLSRRARIADGSAPPALHDYWLREMDFSTGDASLVSAGAGKTTCEYVFFPGCQLGAYNPDHVTQTFARLRETLDVGICLGCCGAPAYWAGDDDRLDAALAQIREQWSALGNPKFIFACTTCTRIFAELLPEIDGVSLYSVLAKDVQMPANAPLFATAAIFDPCATNDDEDTQNAVRALAASLGVAIDELPKRGKCCGYGGNIQLANPSLYDEITANRAAASDLPYLVYCANCRSVFAQRGKESAHILDVLLGTQPKTVTNIDRKRRNSLEVKRMIAQDFADLTVAPPENAWDALTLVIDAETAERIDRKLIAQSELREAIYLAERDSRYFVSDDGVRQASHVRPALVYWVEYKPLRDNEFEVVSAYYHRMKFNEK